MLAYLEFDKNDIFCIFKLYFVYLRGRKRLSKFVSPLCSPNAHSDPGWNPKPGTGTQSRSPVWMRGTRWVRHYCCLWESALSGSWSQKLEPAIKPRHSDVRHGVSTSVSWPHSQRAVPCFKDHFTRKIISPIYFAFSKKVHIRVRR